MRNPFIYGVGGVLSADIAVPEHERELEFYSSILTTGDAPLWRDDLMNNLGAPIIGLGARTPEYESLPLQWMPHFQVADVAASADTAVKLGGKELMRDRPDDGPSQWAVLFDQFGVAFGIIPAQDGASGDIDLNKRQGRISWLSLTVPQPSQSMDFYQQVIGWNANEATVSDPSSSGFEMLINEETSAAAILQSSNEEDAHPPVWLIHLPVDDLAESLARVADRGGKVIKEYVESGYAVISDPVGVCLALQSD